jgi:hypothetical protein
VVVSQLNQFNQRETRKYAACLYEHLWTTAAWFITDQSKSHFYQAPLSNGHFFRSRRLYTGLTMWRFQNVRAFSSHVSTKQTYENNTLPHLIQKKSIFSIPSAIKESKEIFLTTEFKMSFLPGEFMTEKKF